jgi:hypothetical protein
MPTSVQISPRTGGFGAPVDWGDSGMRLYADRPDLRLRQLAADLGLLVWLVGPVTLVPAMDIMPSPREQGARRVLLVAGFHLAYGLVLGLVFNAFSRTGRQR